jgi:uncharacterized protein YbjT (DUF2867 family)
MPRGGPLEMMIAPTGEWPQIVNSVAPDAVICALGTTWRKAGRDQSAFREVDHDLVLAVARAAKEAGTQNFVLVSSAGADPLAKTFYLKVKGETEGAVGKLKFRRCDILRPGLLRGPRGDDRRPLERLALAASPLTDLLLLGKRSGFRSIDAHLVAKAALQCGREKAAGRFLHDNDAIRRLARQLDGAA